MALPISNPRISASMKMKRVSDAMKPQKTAMAKRGSTLKNKVGGLSKLCDIAVYMIAVGADGKINAWPENQQDLKSVLLNYKNLKRGFKDRIEKGPFSVEKGFLKIVDDRKNRDLGIQDNCLGAKLESLNERIEAVTMKMMMIRDDGKCSFMDVYKNMMEPDVADQQQQSSFNLNLNLHPGDLVIPTPKPKPNLIGQINLNLDPGELVIPTSKPNPNFTGQINLNLDPDDLVIPTSKPNPNFIGQINLNLDPGDLVIPTSKPNPNFIGQINLNLDPDDVVIPTPKPSPNLIGQFQQQKDYLYDHDLELPEDDMKLLLSDCEIGLMDDDTQFYDNLDDYEPTVDIIYDMLSWVLGDEDHYYNGVMEDDGHDVAGAVPSMYITDDDMRLLLTDCEIGLMQEDVQLCDNDFGDFLAPLETMLLQDPQRQQPHSELNLNF